MFERMYLKLEGVIGESRCLRHRGEIELSSVTWGVRHQSFGNGAKPGNTSNNDVIVSKQSDGTSPILMRACATGQNFSEGLLTIEKVSFSGSVFNSTAVKLFSVLVYSFVSENGTNNKGVIETVTLNCADIKVVGR